MHLGLNACILVDMGKKGVIIMNYQALEASYNGLRLTPRLQSKDQLRTLEKWCYLHVSRDIRYNDKDDNNRYTLYKKLADNFINFLQRLPKNLDSQLPELNGLNPIQYAATQGYDRYIESFKHSNITLNAINASVPISNMTALHFAAVKGYLYTTQSLISINADPKLVNQNNQLPLHCSLMVPALCSDDMIIKKTAIFSLLYELAPNTILQKDASGQSVFHLMAIHPKLDDLLAKMLQSNPGAVKERNNHARMPVHEAILQNNISAVKLLLQIPGVAKLQDAHKRTPLHYAAAYGTAEMVTLCKLHTTDSEAKDKEGLTPLELANKRENSGAISILNTPACH